MEAGESVLKETVSKASILDKQLIQKYSAINNASASLDILIRLALHGVCIAGAYWLFSNQYYVFGALVLIPHFIAYSFLGWAGIGHELFHNTVFSSKALNSFLFRLFSILTWNNYKYFEVTHWKHHKDTLLPDDPEGDPDQGLSKSIFVWLILIDIPGIVRRIKVLSMNSFGVVPGGLSLTLFAPGTKARQGLIGAARAILLFHLLLIATFIYFKLYWLILMITFAPFILTFFNRILAVSQHFGTTPADHSNYFSSTRTVVLDRMFSFLYANMNYHVEHHFFPFIPYYNLPAVHQSMLEKNEYKHYSVGIVSLVRDLRTLGCFKD